MEDVKVHVGSVLKGIFMGIRAYWIVAEVYDIDCVLIDIHHDYFSFVEHTESVQWVHIIKFFQPVSILIYMHEFLDIRRISRDLRKNKAFVSSRQSQHLRRVLF